MLKATNLSFRQGDSLLFENLDFVVHPGQCVAVAGRNGVGKSTLFKLILSQLQPELGDITFPAQWQTAYMQQEVKVTQRQALDFVVDGHQQLRQTEKEIDQLQLQAEPNAQKLAHLHSLLGDLGGYEANSKAAEILAGLGFAPDDLQKPYADFSGGWRIRLNLAQALMTPCDLLLLDEPTNHLDLEAIMWLEQWLKHFPGTVLLIAHDRAFLDQTTDHTLYLGGKTGKLYRGNYSSCERQRAEYAVLQQASQQKQAARAAHMQQFVDRFRAKASKAKQVQSRIKALARMQESPTLHLDPPYKVSFSDPQRVSNPLFSLRKVNLGYDGNTVLEDVSQSILPGARIGVMGENGAGKSTVLKALAAELKPMSGDLSKGTYSEVGYFAQHQLETLDASALPLKTMLQTQPSWREQQARDYLGGWGFDAQMCARPIQTLSGGEKARFVLALLASQSPAVLVLDEPTNHLDLDMRDALIMALADYSGAVIIVSHDRSMLEKTVDELWVIAQGQVTDYQGDLFDYTVNVNKALKTQDHPDKPSMPINNQDGATSKKIQRQDRAQKRQALQAYKKAATKLEKQHSTLEAELKEMEATLADPEIYQTMPAQELDTLLARAGRRRDKLEQIEQEWLDAVEQLETASSQLD